MAPDNGSTEFDFSKIIEFIKKDSNGPGQRAVRILNALATHDVTNYDTLCFCVEYLASLAGTMTWLEEPTKELVRLLYIAHYIRSEGVEWLQRSNLQSGASEQDTTAADTT